MTAAYVIYDLARRIDSVCVKMRQARVTSFDDAELARAFDHLCGPAACKQVARAMRDSGATIADVMSGQIDARRLAAWMLEEVDG